MLEFKTAREGATMQEWQWHRTDIHHWKQDCKATLHVPNTNCRSEHCHHLSVLQQLLQLDDGDDAYDLGRPDKHNATQKGTPVNIGCPAMLLCATHGLMLLRTFSGPTDSSWSRIHGTCPWKVSGLP